MVNRQRQAISKHYQWPRGYRRIFHKFCVCNFCFQKSCQLLVHIVRATKQTTHTTYSKKKLVSGKWATTISSHLQFIRCAWKGTTFVDKYKCVPVYLCFFFFLLSVVYPGSWTMLTLLVQTLPTMSIYVIATTTILLQSASFESHGPACDFQMELKCKFQVL